MFKKLKKIISCTPLSQNYVLTFTKKWIGRLMWFSIFTIIATFGVVLISSFLHLEVEIVTSLIDLEKKIVTLTLGAIIGYMTKAFFETYAEEKMKLLLSNDESNNFVENELDEVNFGEDENE